MGILLGVVYNIVDQTYTLLMLTQTSSYFLYSKIDNLLCGVKQNLCTPPNLRILR